MYLIEHPDHGQMHVYSVQELVRHIALGWTQVIEPEPVTDKKAK
jgi:hypothetical protein